jgi:hypothetical protein
VDAVTRGLRGGRFLLIVAGDGVREDIAGLAELVNRNSALGFSFGLVELALYDFGADGLAVQSRVPLRGHSVERHVMVLPGGETLIETDQQTAEAETLIGSDGGGAGAEKQELYREWWRPVLGMRFDDPDQEPPVLHWPNHVRVRLPWPKTWITAYRNEAANGTSGIFLAGHSPDRDQLLALLEPTGELVAELPAETFVRNGTSSGKLSIYTERANNSFATPDDCRAWLMAGLNQYVNVLRPRLKRLATELAALEPDADILDPQVVPHPRQPALAADAAVLDAARRCLLAADEPAIDPDRARFERAGEA